MTLREMIDVIGIDENPMECAFVIVGLLRTTLQGEPSTFEGECASLLKATEAYGPVNEPETIRKWLASLGSVPDLDVPDSLWESMVTACDNDAENDWPPLTLTPSTDRPTGAPRR